MTAAAEVAQAIADYVDGRTDPLAARLDALCALVDERSAMSSDEDARLDACLDRLQERQVADIRRLEERLERLEAEVVRLRNESPFARS